MITQQPPKKKAFIGAYIDEGVANEFELIKASRKRSKNFLLNEILAAVVRNPEKWLEGVPK